MAVSLIDAPDYFAQSHCTFKTDSTAFFQGTVSPTGTQQLLVGPPQPIHGVGCQGVCLTTYGESISFYSALHLASPRQTSNMKGEEKARGGNVGKEGNKMQTGGAN